MRNTYWIVTECGFIKIGFSLEMSLGSTWLRGFDIAPLTLVSVTASHCIRQE